MIRRLIVVMALLLVAFGGLFLWKQTRESLAASAAATATPAPMPVATAVVEADPEPVRLRSVGSLEAVRQVTLAPEVSGRVVRIAFTPGASVREGDPLVQLFDAPERADLVSLQAKAKFAQSQLGRSESLVPTGAQTRVTLDQRKSEFEQASADIQRTQALIAQKTVRAPFSGELGLRRINVGQYLNAGDPIATLTDLSEIHVNFALPQQTLGKLRLGQTVEVKTDVFPDKIFTARVTAIEPQIGNDTRNVTLQATLANPDRLLRPGMYVQTELVLSSEPQLPTVPDTAVLASAAGPSVVLVRDIQGNVGTAEHRQVQTGRQVGERIAIVEGLAAGDVVITSGQLRIMPGARVLVRNQKTVRATSRGGSLQ